MRKFLIALGVLAMLAGGIGVYVVSTAPAYACSGNGC